MFSRLRASWKDVMRQMNCQSAVLKTLNNKMAKEPTAVSTALLHSSSLFSERSAASSLARAVFYTRFDVILGVWVGLCQETQLTVQSFVLDFISHFHPCSWHRQWQITQQQQQQQLQTQVNNFPRESLQVLLRCSSLVKGVSAVRKFSGAVCSFFAR